MEEQILKEIQEIKKLLQVIVSNQEQEIEKNSVTINIDAEKISNEIAKAIHHQKQRGLNLQEF